MIPVGFCLVSFGTPYSHLRQAAQYLDTLGFDSIWLWDHYVSWNDPRESVLECWTTLSALAEATRHIRLGSLVANIVNRHPARLAKVAATLNEIAHGRCEVGIGAGGMAFEQAAFGIEQGSPGERVARVAEALQLMPALWTGEPVTFAGAYYQVHDAHAAPPQQPPPPLLVGASGPRMARIAGRYADGLNLQWRSRADFPRLFAALDEGLAQRGRDRSGFDLSVHPGWHDMQADPPEMLRQWAALGFTRALVYVKPPFPLNEFTRLAEQLAR
jgi:alkanesulfonate monooxygenase SsuD/methylene tetrahydromethanopterin reductase-like flavin-dependent oxidoreductase (luciferase family)